MPKRLRLLVSLLFFGISCLATSIFARIGESELVRQLWLISVIGFGVTQLNFQKMNFRTLKKISFSKENWLKAAAVLLVVGVGFALRFYQLDTLPFDFHGDMASMGIEARAYLLGEKTDWFTTGWAEIPFLGFAPAILSMKVFGNNLFGLNMSAVVAGTLSLLGTFLLAQTLFGRFRLSILATALLTINMPHLHFSRLAAYMDPVPWLIFAAIMFWRGLQKNQSNLFAWAGLFFGLAFQMYYSGRIGLFLLITWLMVTVIFWRKQLKRNLLGIAFLLMGWLIVLGPSLWFYIEHPFNFNLRTKEVFLFYPAVMNHLQNKYSVDGWQPVLIKQAELSLRMFDQTPDSSTQFGWRAAMFEPGLAVFLWLGVLICLMKFRRRGHLPILTWLLLILVVGGILTGDAPFWPRLVVILPAATILIALAIDQIWQFIETKFHFLISKPAQLLFNLTVAIALIYLGYLNFSHYFTVMSQAIRPQAFLGRTLANLPNNSTICAFTQPYALNIRESNFLIWPRQIIDLYPTFIDRLQLQAQYPNCFRGNSYFVVTNENLPQFLQLFPNMIDHMPASTQLNESGFSVFVIPNKGIK